MFNYEDEYSIGREPYKFINVQGRCWEPRLEINKYKLNINKSRALNNKSLLAFPPTYKGVVSTLIYDVTNTSEIPVVFDCKIQSAQNSEATGNVFWLPVSNGVLAPMENAQMIAQFSPNTEGMAHGIMYVTCVEKRNSADDNILVNI